MSVVSSVAPGARRETPHLGGGHKMCHQVLPGKGVHLPATDFSSSQQGGSLAFTSTVVGH